MLEVWGGGGGGGGEERGRGHILSNICSRYNLTPKVVV